MEFKLVNEASFDFGHIANMIDEISIGLNSFFKEKNFGNDLESIIICFISTSPEFDLFMKPKKPKYTKGTKEFVNNGVKLTVSNSLRFDIKLDHDVLISTSSIEDLRPVIYSKIMMHVHLFNQIKIRDFDTALFLKELEAYFKLDEL